MARDTITGSRIRERRLAAGLRQADLARDLGISASYLNLIEHNRRRVGDDLLAQISARLGVDSTMLSDGAEAALIASLREAAAAAGRAAGAEIERADEFAGRFPGWAAVLAGAQRRIASLERTVQTLSDRLSHDPNLAASLHEVLSTVTAIRSTAAILAETGEIEAEWRDRFHRNLDADSRRLAESSKALVTYLGENDTSADRGATPQEEVEAFLAVHGHHFEPLEIGRATPQAIVDDPRAALSEAAQQIALRILTQYAADAALMPLDRMRAVIAQVGPDPARLQASLGLPWQAVFRRLAAMPPTDLTRSAGLVICDASGSIVFRKPVEGFTLPRFGESCPLWPLYSALSRPNVPIRRRVLQAGRRAAQFDCFAIAHPLDPAGLDQDPVYLSTMLILPVDRPADDARPVGSTCRLCVRGKCAARREPSVLSEEF